MSNDALVKKYGLTPTILLLREIFKKSLWLTAYILCGYNETNVKKYPEDTGFDICMNPRLHGSICNLIQYRAWNRLITLLPRGFLKTSIAIAFVIWLIINNPNIRIVIIPNNETNGKSFIAAQQEILQSPLFTACFPDIVDGIIKSQRGSKWSTVQYTVNRDNPPPMGEPTVCLKTLQQKKPSQHYDVEILDDPVDDVNSRTVTERERVKYSIRNLVPLLDNPRVGRIWDIGTRWHFDDAHGELLENPSYMKLVMSIVDDEGKPTFPEKYPLSILPKLREDCQTERDYAANYMNNPIAEEDAVFLKKIYMMYRTEQEKEKRDMIKILQERNEHGHISWKKYSGIMVGRLAFLDSASKSGHDMDALVVEEKYDDGRVLIPYVKAGNWGTTERIRELEYIVNTPELTPMRIGIEESGQHDMESILGERVMRGETKLRPDMLYPMRPGNEDKRWRCQMSLEPLFDSYLLYFRDNLPELVFDELKMFPQHKWDDIVDAIAWCNLLFQELGIFGAVMKSYYTPRQPLYAEAGV